MAVLQDRITLSLEDLEEQLGEKKLPAFIRETEDAFVSRTEEVVTYIETHPGIRAILVSGPTSSGKTTFTDRLVSSLESRGLHALRLSLDDYYNVAELQFDRDGRPDYESISTLDIDLAAENIKGLLRGVAVHLPLFDFSTRKRRPPTGETIRLHRDGYVLVEGLHGLSQDILAAIPQENRVGIFIMPWGEVVADRRLIETQEIRLLRRIIRDVRHRGAHALATIDYWPMIASSEQQYFTDYLTAADFYVNSFLTYESMVVAPLALADLREAISAYEHGVLAPSVFLGRYREHKEFADLPRAMAWARQLAFDLARIPAAPKSIVPVHSILHEFI